jgi:hypothetical protein
LLLIASLLSGPVLAGGTPPPAVAQTKTPENAFVDRLIGTWDVTYDLYDKDGKVRHVPGQVTYAWILDGEALQEIWSDVDGKAVKPYGTMISYMDAKHGRWNETWVYPGAGMTMLVSGNVVDGRMVLTGHDQDGALQRWTTGDIQADAFVGRYESSQDGGKTWRILSVNHMRRHAVP